VLHLILKVDAYTLLSGPEKQAEKMHSLSSSTVL